MNFKKNLLTLTCILLSSSAIGLTSDQYQLTGVGKDFLKNIEGRLAALKVSKQPIAEQEAYFVKEIKLALQPYGYFNPKVTVRLLSNNINAKWSFNVALGEPMLIRHIDISLTGPGKDNPALNKFIDAFPIKRGDIFNANNYQSAKDKLFEIANNEGYIYANLQKTEVLLDTKSNQATIILYLDTKERYYLGDITFDNNPNTYDPAFLMSFFRFKPQQVFSTQTLIARQQDIERTNYFQKVIITPEFSQTTQNRIPLKVAVEPPKSQKYSLGLGYGTFTNARVSSAVSIRNFNTLGHSIDAKLNFSSIISNFIAQYSIPGRNPLTDKWNFGVNAQIFTPKNVSTRSTSIYGGYETKIDKVKTTTNLSYLLEKYKFESLPSKVSRLLYPKITFDYIDADNLINSSIGKSISLSLGGSAESILSSTSFLQSELKFKTLMPIYSSRFILRGDVGYSLIHNVDALPASLYFYAGTLNGLRGYPQSSEGQGRYLTIGSAEYQQHIKNNWYAALFFDVGRAGEHINGLYSKAVGVGVVYQSIIGPVRVYAAHALNRENRKNSIEFNIGPEF